MTSLPEKLWPLLQSFASTSAVADILGEVQQRGWTLDAEQILKLYCINRQTFSLSWPLANEKAKITLERHPIYKVLLKPASQEDWKSYLWDLQKLRWGDSKAGAKRTLDLWFDSSDYQRNDIIILIEGHIVQEDAVLLRVAEENNSDVIQRNARILQGRINGPLQDKLLHLLSQVIIRDKIGLNLIPFEMPEILPPISSHGIIVKSHSANHLRLVSALPIDQILKTLNIDSDFLLEAAYQADWSLGNHLENRVLFDELTDKIKNFEDSHLHQLMPFDLTNFRREWAATLERLL